MLDTSVSVPMSDTLAMRAALIAVRTCEGDLQLAENLTMTQCGLWWNELSAS